jgi:hypothetical protein
MGFETYFIRYQRQQNGAGIPAKVSSEVIVLGFLWAYTTHARCLQTESPAYPPWRRKRDRPSSHIFLLLTATLMPPVIDGVCNITVTLGALLPNVNHTRVRIVEAIPVYRNAVRQPPKYVAVANPNPTPTRRAVIKIPLASPISRGGNHIATSLGRLGKAAPNPIPKIQARASISPKLDTHALASVLSPTRRIPIVTTGRIP